MATLYKIPFDLISLLLLVIILEFEASEAYRIGNPKTTVEIINNLYTVKENMTLHCKSKDDDLGFHTIMHWDSYQFSFHPNIFLTTLYFCSFTWHKEPFLHYFDIYKETRDGVGNFWSWRVYEDGACKHHKSSPWAIKCIPWNKQPSTYMKLGPTNTA